MSGNHSYPKPFVILPFLSLIITDFFIFLKEFAFFTSNCSFVITEFSIKLENKIFSEKLIAKRLEILYNITHIRQAMLVREGMV
ncbi:hypothetical protein TK11N_10850 [Tetragenococcus koreensis]|uniref:Uncharacterized protein n=1 Tax=Tetragenococcus koreensis TaxID=290335 RepID=A0AAN4ZRT5_9ENTE|nr:hypothetical protein TK11N_10850 [Tetragenococcus koreensis]GEQ52335.1 hypothetical protein TK12N_16790 [Tetragenococcus koreensis]GEQ54877.1 hypothetical protein TK2N_17210 [Tetragenococcus koreensis]GEQ57336.1 hypothetical protein TK4N_16790 [Tetragenococcus koreensis]GEQ59246.1 hypothetical protein TK6N_10850 [Tetragenococcus koreensis]